MSADVKIHHSIFVPRDVSEQIFSEYGIQLEHEAWDKQSAWGSYDITEDHPRWPQALAALTRNHSVLEAIRGSPLTDPEGLSPTQAREPAGFEGDRVWTEFSDKERRRSSFLEIRAWHHGYPQPEDMKLDAPSSIDKLPYLRRTYDFSNACEKCWVGAKQIARFRMRKSPAWGRRSMLQLNWVPDEFFVKPDVYDAVFRPFGIGFTPAVLHKTEAELETVVQLSVPAVSDVRVDGIPFGVCSGCGRKNYHRSCRGFPPMPMHSDAPMFKSTQSFHGFERRVFVTNSLYRKIAEANLKGAEFDPCLEDSK